MSEDIKKKIDTLVGEATATKDCDKAMRFTQAALNAAHAYQVLAQIDRP